MLNFLRDPTGDTPWEEDTTAKDVVHVRSDSVSLNQIIIYLSMMVIIFVIICYQNDCFDENC